MSGGPKIGDIFQVGPHTVGNVRRILYKDDIMIRMQVEVVVEETNVREILTVTINHIAIHNWTQPTIH